MVECVKNAPMQVDDSGSTSLYAHGGHYPGSSVFAHGSYGPSCRMPVVTAGMHVADMVITPPLGNSHEG